MQRGAGTAHGAPRPAFEWDYRLLQHTVGMAALPSQHNVLRCMAEVACWGLPISTRKFGLAWRWVPAGAQQTALPFCCFLKLTRAAGLVCLARVSRRGCCWTWTYRMHHMQARQPCRISP